MLSAQIVLTPVESKRLLSRSILNMPAVKKALDSGTLIVHPSSTTIFMLEELGLKLPAKGIWICGHISPKGLCISRGMIDARLEIPGYGPDKYPFELIIKKGALLPLEQSALGPALEEMTAADVYVKGVNALDPEGKAAILLAARSTGGSIGVVLKKQKEKKFKMILPVGLEKKIPIPLSEALKAALKTDKAQGIPCGLWRIRGEVVTEIDAFRRLFDVEAVPISAGGVCGAEGAIVWIVRGEEDKVERALAFCREIHGHELPYTLDVYECEDCQYEKCHLRGQKWPPGPAYVLFYGGLGLGMLGGLIWMEQHNLGRWLRRELSLLGKASLFLFVLQFFVYMSVFYPLRLAFTFWWPVYFGLSVAVMWGLARLWLREGLWRRRDLRQRALQQVRGPLVWLQLAVGYADQHLALRPGRHQVQHVAAVGLVLLDRRPALGHLDPEAAQLVQVGIPSLRGHGTEQQRQQEAGSYGVRHVLPEPYGVRHALPALAAGSPRIPQSPCSGERRKSVPDTVRLTVCVHRDPLNLSQRALGRRPGRRKQLSTSSPQRTQPGSTSSGPPPCSPSICALVRMREPVSPARLRLPGGQDRAT